MLGLSASASDGGSPPARRLAALRLAARPAGLTRNVGPRLPPYGVNPECRAPRLEGLTQNVGPLLSASELTRNVGLRWQSEGLRRVSL